MLFDIPLLFDLVDMDNVGVEVGSSFLVMFLIAISFLFSVFVAR